LQDIVDRPAAPERLVAASGVERESAYEFAVVGDDADVRTGHEQADIPSLVESTAQREGASIVTGRLKLYVAGGESTANSLRTSGSSSAISKTIASRYEKAWSTYLARTSPARR
jgi:hypothetical protein